MTRSEKQKMLAGELYRALDAQLQDEQRRAQQLMHTLNQSGIHEVEKIRTALENLLGGLGRDSIIRPPFYCDYGSNIYIGHTFFANFGCVFLDPAEIHIGNEVMMASYVQLYTATHPLDPELRCSGREYAKPIRIKDRVWIGGGAMVMPGVTVGENSVVGAGAIVTKDVPPNVVVAGNPARIVREITAEERGKFA